MDERRLVKVSKYLSRHLRHVPERIGLTPDDAGWVDVDTLRRACAAHGFRLSAAELDEVVRRNDKQRFAYDGDRRRIRANQGHTIPVDLGLPAVEPPPRLFHGTSEATATAVLREGLRPMRRHAVHLSPDPGTARRVGSRHGPPIVLEVDAARMAADGHRFAVSANGVWLTDAVPAKYLQRLPTPAASRRG